MSETSRFGDLHTKTYDIELLISGALVFGLFTIPGELTALFDRWGARVDGLASPAVTYFFVYGQMIVYSMLVTFIAHLCLRGYWIALLGLESVWSDGWSWERLKIGPYTRARIENRVSSLSAAINAADDRASVIFAAGALLVMVSLYSLLIVVAAIAAGLLIETATGIAGPQAFFVVLFAALALAVLIPRLDKRLGPRIDPASPAGRRFSRLIGFGLLLSPLRWTAPVQFVFQSRLGERKLAAAMSTAAGALGVALVAGMMFRAGVVRIDGWDYFDPDTAEAAGTVSPRHYRDSGTRGDGRQPTIDSDIITGPLIRLYLPYRPRRHNALIAEACPELAAAVARGDAPDNAAGATCLGNLHKVSLDGALLTPSYRFTRDAATDFVGVLAYLPTAAMPAGSHELTIDAPRGDGNRQVIRIPFQTVPR